MIRKTTRRVLRGTAGVTLTELMIAAAILSTAVIGLVGSFASIQKAMQVSKYKSLAANLAQEKMQILKQLNYYRVLVTPAPSCDSRYTPCVPYDPSYFPPETILEGGIPYTRLTLVQTVTEDSGQIVIPSPIPPDTGMKLITVSVIWLQGGEYKLLSINSVLANPDTVMTSASITGTVKDIATSANIAGAVVNVSENLGWRDTTNATGNFGISAMAGTFNLFASARGYFSQFLPISVTGTGINVPITLQAMSSGTVSGTAWINSHLVISQVVASTAQVQYNLFNAQYIELYNPTPNTITIGGATPAIKVNFQAPAGCSNTNTCADSTYGIKLDYVNTTVAPYHYYIIANTGTFTVNGVNVVADAVFADNANTYCSAPPAAVNWNTGASPPVKNIIDWDASAAIWHGGTVWLSDASGNVIDSVGWAHNANVGPYCSPYCIPSTGFTTNTQIVRTSSPNFASSTWGRAYDANISSIDFVYPPIISASSFLYRPFSTADSTATPIAGAPAVGAVVTANDGLSDNATAYLTGYPPVAVFSMTNVATGTWIVLITSSSYELENDTVTIAATGSNYIFPSSTTILSSAATQGFIAGYVKDVSGAAISAPTAITVTAGNATATASTVNGRYLLRVSSGPLDVIANPGNANGSYVSATQPSVGITLGQITDGVNFVLSQGGRISGFVTRDGVNALPGVAVTVLDSNGYSRDTQISDTSGRFTTLNVATGTYDVTPELDSLESATPSSISVTVSSGSVVFSSTFTISGAMGNISGSVSVGGSPISTGVLIVVTTTTLAGSPPAPPALSSNTLTSSPYYLTSSNESGTYSIDVRQSTSPAYNVYGYYTTVSSTGGVTFQSTSLTNVAVLAGSSVTGKNFSW